MKNTKFSFLKRIQSFAFAFNGLKILFRTEHNARIHLTAAVVVIGASAYFELHALEWVAIIFAIGFVISTEIINTAIEQLADFWTTEQNAQIKIIKDLSAAAVLVSALTALTIGLIIFLPKINF